MPFPFIALATLLGGLGSAVVANQGAKKNQRAADRRNQQNWMQQNEYNHPMAQMQRLKSSGLNPNLIYGSSPGSATGNAGSQQAPSKAAPYQTTNPGMDFMDGAVKQAQTANLDQDAILKAAQAIKVGEDSKLTEQQRKLLETNFNNIATQEQQKALQAVLTTEKLGTETKMAATTAATAIVNNDIAEAKKAVAQLDAKLASNGIRPTDSVYLRLFSAIFGVNFSTLESVNNAIDKLNGSLQF